MKSYPKMKDSGIEWIGDIPEHWIVNKLKHLVDNTKYYQIGDGDHGSIKPEMYLEEGIPYIRVQNLSWNGKISYDGLVYISDEVHRSNLKSQLIEGDILIAKTGATIGKLGLVDKHIGISNTTSSVGKITIDNTKHSNLFYLFFFQSSLFQHQILVSGNQKSAQPGFNIDDLVNFLVLIPPLHEQQQITSFLNKKIISIDSRILKNYSLIELLKEKQQTIIDHVLTRGLDPTAQMCDSKIEWIGNIPKHWKLIPFRHILLDGSLGIKIGPFGSAITLNEMVASGYKIYGQENIIRNNFEFGNRYISSKKFSDLKVYELLPDDVLITMMGSGTPGKSRVFPNDAQPGIMDSHLVRIRTNLSLAKPDFIAFLINSSNYVKVQVEMSYRGSTMTGLNSSILKNFLFCLPPLEEQNVIMNFLQNKTFEIKNLILKIENQTKKLSDLRKSLIFSTVTGKINVENL